MSGIKMTQEKIQELIRLYQTNLTTSNICRTMGISMSTLYKYRTRIIEECPEMEEKLTKPAGPGSVTINHIRLGPDTSPDYRLHENNEREVKAHYDEPNVAFNNKKGEDMLHVCKFDVDIDRGTGGINRELIDRGVTAKDVINLESIAGSFRVWYRSK